MSPPVTPLFTLSREDTPCLLVGRWHGPTPDDSLYPSYERILAEAKAHGNCRFWLLDMRERAWHSVAFARWYGELLAHQVVQELGSPVFVAYVAAEAHRTAIESATTQAMLRQASQAEFYPYFFSNETDARHWLGYYQAHPTPPPKLPQE